MPTKSARNLGIMIDDQLTFKDQVALIAWSYRFKSVLVILCGIWVKTEGFSFLSLLLTFFLAFWIRTRSNRKQSSLSIIRPPSAQLWLSAADSETKNLEFEVSKKFIYSHVSENLNAADPSVEFPALFRTLKWNTCEALLTSTSDQFETVGCGCCSF